MTETKKKYLLYMIFAVVATFVNIGSQFIIKSLLKNIPILNNFFLNKEITYYFIIQLVIGTGLGFLTKFFLDKIFVFKEKTEGFSKTIKQLIIYGLLALITTAIFWSFEFTFKLVFDFKNSEFVGGIIGLSIGYTVKFLLDKKFVFIQKQPSSKSSSSIQAKSETLH